ncbi:hypothetical protein BD289DRAFT_99709 [Coniella lustricola]|uniref:Glutathione S-transferase n=1 Tax=Coniella lustricola TaxID=2025994 RepID=A0A2T3AN41_9PEZI|nr:hypothetical protein BD289DRAFT_99709 [Coniella lustricola]
MAEEKPKILLHWLNGSRAHSILWLLEDLEEPYEVEVFHRQPNALAPPELTKIHPLGKSPVVSITAPGATKPVVLAETPFIFEYLIEHSEKGNSLVPPRWKPGQEGKMLGETEAWMRYQYLMYYIEGSFMPILVQYIILNAMKSTAVPLLVRPISKAIANRLISMIVFPNMKKHLSFLEEQLKTSGGDFITGPTLTAADIQLAYGMILAMDSFDSMGDWEKGSVKATYPALFAYADRLQQQSGYIKAVEKSKEVDNGAFSLAPRLQL